MMRRYLAFLWATRSTLLVLSLLLLAAGLVALRSMPESVFPAVNFPKISILVQDQDLPVQIMLLQVTRPLEESAEGVAGVHLVRSQTGVGLSKIHVYFDRDANPENVYLRLQARLSHVALPAGASLSVRLMRPNIYPVLQYALVSNRLDSSSMMASYAFVIRPALLSLPGVYQVQETGRGWPELRVQLQRHLLAQYHLSAATVLTALQQNQGPFFSGVLQAFHQQFVLSTAPRPANPRELAQLTLPIGPPNTEGIHAPLPLGALGSVSLGPPPRLRAAAVPGWQHALLFDLSAQQGSNEVQVAHAAEQRLAQLARDLPPGVHLQPVYNLSRLIHSSLQDVWQALALGTLLAFVVVLFFLGRWDAALATLTVVPLSLAGTLLILHALGFGMNIMTLGGITAAVGALVDHAIVIIERGIYGLEHEPVERRRERALQRLLDLLPLMTLATFTSCMLFVPLIFLSGTVGLLFRDMALAIVIALAASQLVAITITPIFALWLAGRPRPARRLWGEAWLRRRYARLLVRGLRRPLLALPVMLVLAGVGALLFMQLPTAFLPHWGEGIFVVPFRTPTGSSSAETLRVGRTLLQIAAQNPNVARVSLVVGRGLGNAHSTANKGGITIVLKDQRPDSTYAVMQQIHQAFRRAAPDLTTLETQQVMVNRLGNMSGSHAPLVLQLYGASPAVLQQAAAGLTQTLRASRAFQSIVLKAPSAGPEIQLQPTPFANIAGESPQRLAQSVKLQFWGVQAGYLLQGEEILPIRVEVQGAQGTAPQDLAALAEPLPNGRVVPLGQAAAIHLRAAVPYVMEQNLVPVAEIRLNPRLGEGLSQAAARLQRLVDGSHLPAGVGTQITGYYQAQQKSFQQMLMILAAALLLLLVLLGFQFGSQRAAVAVLLAIAFAAPGALLVLWLTGTDLDSSSMLGILLVFAIAVNNGILLFARARQLGGYQARPATIAWAARQRFRPILMTMLADVFGFLPLAIGIGHGTGLLQPLALSVMGALLLATFTSLWLAPVLYSALFTLTERKSWKRSTGLYR
ncbi:MAG: efflux RND transporter permease subunit [Candidatus Igneacidithiobacillus chanchocoensis]